MSLGDELAALAAVPGEGYEPARATKPSHPAGWEPGVSFDHGAGRGSITSRPREAPVSDWNELLVSWGFDPAKYQVLADKVHVRTWDAPIGNGETKQLWYYKADVIKRGAEDGADIDDLLKLVRKHKPTRKVLGHASSHAMVVCIADSQMGKGEREGAAGTVDRLLRQIDDVETRVKELRAQGRIIDTLYVFGLGDLIEGCDSHYPQQTFRTTLNRRDQVKVMRHWITKALMRWALLFDRVVVAAVGGNHGELRQNGKSNTDFADNDDVAIFEQVCEILAQNPAYEHVSFVLPNDDLTITLDVCGTLTALAHGHQCKKGSSPQQKIENWWAGQAHGMMPAGDATLLLTGHYHHLQITQSGRKTHIQAPANDCGSQWFTNMTGKDAPPGLLTLVVGGGGWGDVAVV